MLASSIRAMPETEIPPARRVDNYLFLLIGNCGRIYISYSLRKNEGEITDEKRI